MEPLTMSNVHTMGGGEIWQIYFVSASFEPAKHNLMSGTRTS